MNGLHRPQSIIEKMPFLRQDRVLRFENDVKGEKAQLSPWRGGKSKSIEGLSTSIRRAPRCAMPTETRSDAVFSRKRKKRVHLRSRIRAAYGGKLVPTERKGGVAGTKGVSIRKREGERVPYRKQKKAKKRWSLCARRHAEYSLQERNVARQGRRGQSERSSIVGPLRRKGETFPACEKESCPPTT